ncbi:MAG: glycosyltransferase family 4 protein [Trueperaceae bacterium]|nr:glycosyltransferase family 4 protein [Trueperaceae bacterium]
MKNIEMLTLPVGPKWVRGPRRLALDWSAGLLPRASLLHFFDFAGPLLTPWRPFSATVYDAHIIRNPGSFDRLALRHKLATRRFVASRARGLIAISRFARDEAVQLLGVPSRRVRVVYPGPGLPASVPHEKESPARKDFLLYVGGFAAWKAVPFLVQVHAAMQWDIPLVLVGREDAEINQVRSAIARSHRRQLITLETRADDDKIHQLYSEARAFVFASRYEGFGLPVTEAMARGCPVVASDIPAIREVAGRGIRLVPPTDVSAWASTLDKLVASPELCTSLAQDGLEVVSGLSWDRAARETWDTIARIAGGQLQ